MIAFQPDKRSILFCDFSGMRVPEIVKKRPVVIIKKHKKNSKLVYVLPISITTPNNIENYHHKLEQSFCKKYFKDAEHYVKADLIYTISIDRLYLVKLRDGNRCIPIMEEKDFILLLESFKKYMNL